MSAQWNRNSYLAFLLLDSFQGSGEKLSKTKHFQICTNSVFLIFTFLLFLNHFCFFNFSVRFCGRLSTRPNGPEASGLSITFHPKTPTFPRFHINPLTPSNSAKMNGHRQVVRHSPGLNLIRLTLSDSAKFNGYNEIVFIKTGLSKFSGKRFFLSLRDSYTNPSESKWIK